MTSKEDPFRQEKNLKGVSRVQGRVSRVQMCPVYRIMCPVYRGVPHCTGACPVYRVQGRVPCTGACAQRDLQEALARRPIQRRLLVLVGFVDVGAGFDEGNGGLG